MYEYYCAGCKETFSPERYIRVLHCPYCGQQYDIMVLKHNNIRKNRAEYISKHFFKIIFLGAFIALILPLLFLNNLETLEYILLGSLGSWVAVIFIGGFTLKTRAKKLFPD